MKGQIKFSVHQKDQKIGRFLVDFLWVAGHLLGRGRVEAAREEVWRLLPRRGCLLSLDHEGTLATVLVFGNEYVDANDFGQKWFLDSHLILILQRWWTSTQPSILSSSSASTTQFGQVENTITIYSYWQHYSAKQYLLNFFHKNVKVYNRMEPQRCLRSLPHSRAGGEAFAFE